MQKLTNKIIFIIILLLIVSFSLKAQNETTQFDSIIVLNENEQQESELLPIPISRFAKDLFVYNSNITDNFYGNTFGRPLALQSGINTEDDEPSKSQFWPIFRTLFGFSLGAGYSYMEELYIYSKDPGKGGDRDNRGLYLAEHIFKDGQYTVELMTPIINFNQEFSFNYFSNENLNGVKYEKTHIDFMGVTRLGEYLEKYKNKKYTVDRFNKWVKWLPFFDRRVVKTPDYSFNEIKIGTFYNVMSYTRTEIQNRNASYTINEKMYEGFRVDVVCNELTIIDMRGLLEYYYISLLNNHKLGKDAEHLITNKFMEYYTRFPFYYIKWVLGSVGSVTIHDINENKIFDENLNWWYINFEIGFTYGKPIIIPKINLIIIPDIYWSVFNLSHLYHPRLQARINIKYYL